MAIYKSISRAKISTASPVFASTNSALGRTLNSSRTSIVDSINVMSRDTPKGEYIVSVSATTAESIYPAFDAVMNCPLATVRDELLSDVASQAHVARILNGEKTELGAVFRISARYASRTAYKMGYKPITVTTAVIGKNGEINNTMFALAQVLDDFAQSILTTSNIPDELVDEFTTTCQAVIDFNDAIRNPEPVAPVADAPSTSAKAKKSAPIDNAPTKA